MNNHHRAKNNNKAPEQVVQSEVIQNVFEYLDEKNMHLDLLTSVLRMFSIINNHGIGCEQMLRVRLLVSLSVFGSMCCSSVPAYKSTAAWILHNQVISLFAASGNEVERDQSGESFLPPTEMNGRFKVVMCVRKRERDAGLNQSDSECLRAATVFV